MAGVQHSIQTSNKVMMMSAAAKPTLVETLWPASQDSLVRSALIAVAGSGLLWLSAKVQVPFWPVPMTLQSMVVLMLGATLGWRLGLATVGLYLLEGAAGLPVFAGTPEKGLGLLYMAGPTGGYLVGFVAGAAAVGFLAARGWDRSIPWMFAAMCIGHAVIFAAGWAWLATIAGPEKAWILGVAPFYAATLLKTALAALAVPATWRAATK